ncbi:MAG TPA: hypothetical protein VFY92_09405 [Hyphomicrobiaceae bacterium]|nr:hypothetical protein [Hyphomicrobiaceae bacterium]
MRFPHHVRMSVTRRDDKELRLGAFISRGLGGAVLDAAIARPLAGPAILVMARSARSPVVRSLCTLTADIAAAKWSVRIILAKAEHDAADGGRGQGLAALRHAVPCEVRRGRNPRLIEAHEQLVIGARICWTGDTMRRDPATCDAYESFVEDCPEIAAAAAATFERLWTDCTPLVGLALPVATASVTPKAIAPPPSLVRRTGGHRI